MNTFSKYEIIPIILLVRPSIGLHALFHALLKLPAVRYVNESDNVDTLAKKTGFDKKKISNILYKLKKAGKVNVISRGVYTKV